MNAELLVISKVIQDRDLGPAIERGMDSEWFLGYKSTWDFIQRYNEKYGGLPSRETVEQAFEGLVLPQVQETFEYCSDQLIDQLMKYRLKIIAGLVQDKVDTEDPRVLLSEITSQVYDLSVDFAENPDQDIIHDFRGRLEKTTEQVSHFELNRKPKVLPSGFDHVDQKAPFMDGNLITFIGDTGSLKSYFIQYIAMNVVMEKHVSLLSLEMTKDEVGWRGDAIGAHLQGIEISNRGMIYGEGIDLAQYRSSLEQVAGMTDKGLWVSDTTGSVSGVGSAQVIAKFDHYVRRFGNDFGLFIVDYTTLLEDANDWKDIKSITRRLKVTAQRLGKPCVQIAQARRGQRGREITRDDVGYSWGMVEDSDKVFTITREPNGYLSILCDKNRLGEEGWKFMVQVRPDKGSFVEVEDNTLSHKF